MTEWKQESHSSSSCLETLASRIGGTVLFILVIFGMLSHELDLS